MPVRSSARLAGLVAVASIVAGCGASDGDGGSPTAHPQLQLRLVTSTTQGPCSAAPLTSDAAGSACDLSGTASYELGESLGVVTPTSVTRGGQGSGQTVVVELDKAGAATLAEVTRQALDKQLAILLDGSVLSAPLVKEPITAGVVELAPGTAAEAEQVAAQLGASATP
jgi:preprotein translocase subunit SecD